MSEIQIYDTGEVELEVRYQSETLWLTLGQIADLFGVQKPGVSKHLRNIFSSGELSLEATVSKMETVQSEGGRGSLLHATSLPRRGAGHPVNRRLNVFRCPRSLGAIQIAPKQPTVLALKMAKGLTA